METLITIFVFTLVLGFYVAYISFFVWIAGIIVKATSDEGAKKGYNPVWSAVNGSRFGLFALIWYKYIAPDLNKPK